MSSRSKRKLNQCQSRQQQQEIDGAFLRASEPGAYFKAKSKVHDRLSANGITLADLKKAYEKGRDDGSHDAFESVGTIYTCAMIDALNTLHGFGAKRLVTIMDHMNEFMTEKLTSQEAMQAVYDKVGLKFFKDDPFHPLQPKE